MRSVIILFALLVATAAHGYIQPRPTTYNTLNLAAGGASLYEVQVRAANACREDTGAEWQRAACRSKISPPNVYRAEGTTCGSIDDLHKIKLGTLDDMMENTADYRAGITLRYIRERVGANTVWIMPLFPNNDRWALPDACDNLGSPYAVRDYMHVSGRADRACIRIGKDEESGENDDTETPCWGNWKLDELVAKAHSMGLKVMLDVALNHFGHNYKFYDYASFIPLRERISRGDDLDALWDYERTFEADLVQPSLVDTADGAKAAADRYPEARAAYDAIRSKCPSLKGDRLVRAFNMWREMLDWERAKFSCETPLYLEHAVPGYYMGRRTGGDPHPSQSLSDNFTNNWRDVKFLYHHEDRAHYHEFVRNREYFFRIVNYWLSRGIDGFRLDHTTDPDSGMGPNEWKYIIGKANFYDWVRKGHPSNHERPIFLAEEFGDQMGMNHVVDAMTEGYVGDMRGGNGGVKNSSHVERVLQNDSRFDGHAYVMRALETHDEHRLFEHTGFDIWTGAGFWGIGATTRGTPMILMGQEFGESWGLGFRRSDFLRSRFEGTSNYRPEGDSLVAFYGAMNRTRENHANRALKSENRWFLRSRHTNQADERIFAQAKWTHVDGTNVLFTFHNLWPSEEWVEQGFFLPPELAGQMGIQDDRQYRLVNAITNAEASGCRRGADLKMELYVKMHRSERLQWLRLESCN